MKNGIDHLIREVASSLLMTQPPPRPSLELEASNVAVVENLKKHGPPASFGIRPGKRVRVCLKHIT